MQDARSRRFRHRKTLAGIFSAVALLALACHGREADASTLKILTFNVRGLPFPLSPAKPARMEMICELLAANAPWDVVMLQELYMNHDQEILIGCGQKGGF